MSENKKVDRDSDSDNDSDSSIEGCEDCGTDVCPGYKYCKECMSRCDSCQKLFGEEIIYKDISNNGKKFTMEVCSECDRKICEYCGKIDTDFVCRCEALGIYGRD